MPSLSPTAVQGIIVTINLDLYVVDGSNHRIQLLRSGQMNGIITLYYPSESFCMLMDIFSLSIKIIIVLLAWGPMVFDVWWVGGSGNGGASNQLFAPQSMSFARNGNLFVVDRSNARIHTLDRSFHWCCV
jgi:hypothetical protein